MPLRFNWPPRLLDLEVDRFELDSGPFVGRPPHSQRMFGFFYTWVYPFMYGDSSRTSPEGYKNKSVALLELEMIILTFSGCYFQLLSGFLDSHLYSLFEGHIWTYLASTDRMTDSSTTLRAFTEQERTSRWCPSSHPRRTAFKSEIQEGLKC